MAQQPGTIAYNYAQLEQIWIAAGGNPQVAPTAAAVALAESGGNPNAVSASNDYGLWQINIVHGSQATLDVMSNARAAVAISNNGTNWGPWCTAWANPQGNCGHFLGAQLQPGSKAAQFVRGGIAPDSTTPINGTGAVTPQAQTTAQTATLTGCTGLEWAISPGGCAAASAAGGVAGAAGGAAEHVAGQIIDLAIGSILNPFIQLIAGVMGITAGGIMMILGLYVLVKDTSAGQTVKQQFEKQEAKGKEAAAAAAGAPEAAPAVATKGTKIQTKTGYHQTQTRKQLAAHRREAMRQQAKRYQPDAASAQRF